LTTKLVPELASSSSLCHEGQRCKRWNLPNSETSTANK